MRTIETWEKRLERHTGHIGPSHIKGHEEAEAMMKLQEITDLRAALAKVEVERDGERNSRCEAWAKSEEAWRATQQAQQEADSALAKLAALAAQEPVLWGVKAADGGFSPYAHWTRKDAEGIAGCSHPGATAGPLYAAAGAAPVPEGRQLVTPEMIAAAEGVEDLYKRGTPQTWAKVFRVMLAAAPKEPS